MPIIDFILIGAMKSGTTTLIKYLRRHPEIYVPGAKEPQYFSRDEVFSRGVEWYESFFDYAKPGQVRGEGSTCYTRCSKYPNSAGRIHRYAPNVKLIYIVRNPVERTYSHFRHSQLRGEINYQTFRQALEAEKELIETSKYMAQIEQYLKYFNDDQFFFLKFDDLVDARKVTFDKLFEFLSVSDFDVIGDDPVSSNKAGVAQSDAVLRRLIKYAKYVPGLSSLVKRKFSPLERKRMVYNMANKLSYSKIGGLFVEAKTKKLPAMFPEDSAIIKNKCLDDLKSFETFSSLDLSNWY